VTAAVLAAVTETWSNGPVEGHVNQLKMIKLQMYGRAGFVLYNNPAFHSTNVLTPYCSFAASLPPG
jgi:transposase